MGLFRIGGFVIDFCFLQFRLCLSSISRILFPPFVVGFVHVAFDAGVEVSGDSGDYSVVLQAGNPDIRNGFKAVYQSQEVANHRTGAVAVAAVIDCRKDTFRKVSGIKQTAKKGNGQGFFGNPTAAQLFDVRGKEFGIGGQNC